MALRHFLLPLMITLSVISGCRKTYAEPDRDEPDPQPPSPAPVVYPQYFPMKAGNYWIYERFRVEQHGVSESLQQFDSSYVVKDTMIRNHQYWVIKAFDFVYSTPVVTYQRDSLHYLIDHTGKILFSSEDFSTVFQSSFVTGGASNADTVCLITWKMNDKDLRTVTPAGTFTTSNMQMTFDFFPAYKKPGLPSPRYMNTRFAKNIGMVTLTEPFYYSFTSFTEKRLIRYGLN